LFFALSLSNVQPNRVTLSGDNYNTSMRVYVPTSPASVALLGALNRSGYSNIGIQGNFGLKVGTLALRLTYYQSMGIPNCALSYVRTHSGGGACGEK
jgi:hypothetical protein